MNAMSHHLEPSLSPLNACKNSTQAAEYTLVVDSPHCISSIFQCQSLLTSLIIVGSEPQSNSQSMHPASKDFTEDHILNRGTPAEAAGTSYAVTGYVCVCVRTIMVSEFTV